MQNITLDYSSEIKCQFQFENDVFGLTCHGSKPEVMKKRIRKRIEERKRVMYSISYSKNHNYLSEGQSLLSMRFPQKLWKIVNECQTDAINWSNEGNSIILNYQKFQEEYLESNSDIFKTSNITSFIRQLNLYGFRKVNHYNRESAKNLILQDFHEFKNERFLRGRQDLLSKVTRKPSTLKSRLNFNNGRHGNTSRIAKCQMALQAALQRQHIILKNKYNQHTTSTRLSAPKGTNNRKKLNDCYFWNVHGKSWSNIQWNSQEMTVMKEESKENVNNSDDKVVEILTQEDIKASGSSTSSISDVNHLLDPTISPKIYHTYETEMANLEDSFTLDSVFSHMDKNLSEKIYQILMTEEDKQGRLNEMETYKPVWPSSSCVALTTVDQNTYTYVPNAIHSCSHHYSDQANLTNWEMKHSQNENIAEPCHFLNPSADGPLFDFGVYDNQTLLQLYPLE